MAACFASGEDLYWPDGIYLTTASIPNFHSVRHNGPGVVKRGTDLFYVDPASGLSNILYVATTGLDANDGLSSSQARLTAQSAGDILYNYRYSDATWKIQFAAGTYVGVATFTRAFPSSQRVQFLGAAVADGVVPTTIFDSPGGASKVGLYFQSRAHVYVEDIKFTDYNDGGTPSVSGNGSGVIIERGDLYARNVHVTNCDAAIEAANESRLRVQAGVLASSAVGVRCISNVTYTIGYNGTAADVTGATGTAVLNCTAAGVFAQEGSTGHVDYSYIDNCAVGVDLIEKSRAHILGCNIRNNATAGVRVRVLSSFYDSPTVPNTYTSNTVKTIVRGDSVNVTRDQDARGGAVAVLRDTTAYATSSTTPVTIATHAFEAGELEDRGAGFTFKLFGEVVGTAGTKNITVTLGATTLLNRTIAAATTDYSIEVEFVTRSPSGAGGQKICTSVFENGASPVITTNIAIAEDMTTALTLTVTHNVANAADLNRVAQMDVWVTR